MNKPDGTLFDLQRMSVAFSQIDRKHYLAGTDQRESDADHTVSVALMAWYIAESNQLALDMTKILQYAIAHDFVEVYAGDVNAFASDEERRGKNLAERQAAERIASEFAGFPGLVSAIQGYEAKKDEEAVFVWTVDKVQALIMGDLDAWRPYREIGVSYERFCDKYRELISQCSPYARQIFEAVTEYSKSTYYDGPGQQKRPENRS